MSPGKRAVLDRPALTPEGRRDQLARELEAAGVGGWRRPARRRAPYTITQRRRAEWRARKRLIQAHQDEYQRYYSEELETEKRSNGKLD